MSTRRTEHDLGLDRPIARRDFLQGALVGAGSVLGGALLGPPVAASTLDGAPAPDGPWPQDRPGYNPSALVGLRGSHPGSFEAAHALRDGDAAPAARDTGETYDLVVVGGGISGLAAAHFYRRRTGGGQRVLVLENHDDFGGHAKRNEFRHAGRLQLLNGGTLGIDSPRPYGPVSAGLLAELGVDPAELARDCEDSGFYRRAGLSPGAFFDRETFGTDRLVVGVGKRPPAELYAEAPLTERARADLVRLETDDRDPYPDLSAAQKKDALSRISYREFLLNVLKLDPAVATYYQARTHGEWGVGIDAVAALDLWGFDFPGFRGMKLPSGSIDRMGYTPAGYADSGGSARFHFPDGNASIARLLVRQLVPGAVPGSSARDVVTARVDYSKLDRARSPARLRLGSTVVRVRHHDDRGSPGDVEVTYLRGGRAFSVRARHCVLACWNAMIPHLCPELPDGQKEALHQAVKTPLVYTSVAIANWTAFQRLGISGVYAPGGYHTGIRLNPVVDIGSYRSPRNPSDPVLVHMLRTPCQPGLPELDQHRAGRAELLATSFATFESEIRSQLARVLGPGGFDPARDITAITVNRWPHGYAREYNPLWDPDQPESQRWNVLGRARFGRVAIANSDAGGGAYTDSAIDQASRAVDEVLAS